MPGRIRLKRLLSLNRAINLPRGNRTLLHDSMGHDSRYRAVKKIEHPVMDALQADAEFVDSISQQIRLRPPQLMPQFAEPFQPKEALRLRLDRKSIEPFQERA